MTKGTPPGVVVGLLLGLGLGFRALRPPPYQTIGERGVEPPDVRPNGNVSFQMSGTPINRKQSGSYNKDTHKNDPQIIGKPPFSITSKPALYQPPNPLLRSPKPLLKDRTFSTQTSRPTSYTNPKHQLRQDPQCIEAAIYHASHEHHQPRQWPPQRPPLGRRVPALPGAPGRAGHPGAQTWRYPGLLLRNLI